MDQENGNGQNENQLFNVLFDKSKRDADIFSTFSQMILLLMDLRRTDPSVIEDDVKNLLDRSAREANETELQPFERHIDRLMNNYNVFFELPSKPFRSFIRSSLDCLLINLFDENNFLNAYDNVNCKIWSRMLSNPGEMIPELLRRVIRAAMDLFFYSDTPMPIWRILRTKTDEVLQERIMQVPGPERRFKIQSQEVLTALRAKVEDELKIAYLEDEIAQVFGDRVQDVIEYILIKCNGDTVSSLKRVFLLMVPESEVTRQIEKPDVELTKGDTIVIDLKGLMRESAVDFLRSSIRTLSHSVNYEIAVKNLPDRRDQETEDDISSEMANIVTEMGARNVKSVRADSWGNDSEIIFGLARMSRYVEYYDSLRREYVRKPVADFD
jgi:hypothetical protein